MILGIDLGTTNSMAAVCRNGDTVLIKSSTGNYLIPSVISMDENGMFYTGDIARERKITHPTHTIDMFKRSMGTGKMFKIGDKELKAEELSAVLLKAIKKDAEDFLGEEITDAVISVPAYFANSQRKAVMCAGELAGFNVRKIVNEPTAAAVAYGIQNIEIEKDDYKVIIVLDLGGGTFDISVVEVGDNVMEVVAICGDNKLGGGDFTKCIIDTFLKENNIERELTADESANLWKKAEAMKKAISKDGQATLNCTVGKQEYSLYLDEAKYEEICFELLEKIRMLTMKAIDESKYHPDEIEEVVMVGGGTKLSIVRKMIEKMVGHTLEYVINPDEAVVRGAAIQGALLEKDEMIKDFVMTDICPFYVGNTICNTGRMDFNRKFNAMIPKNVVIPARGTYAGHFDEGAKVMNVFHAEDEFGTGRTKVGELSFRVPDMRKETIKIHQTIIYDINGIMHLEVYIPDTGETYKKSIINAECEMSVEEAKERANQLKYLNLSARDNDMDRLLMERAERVYTEIMGKEKEQLNLYMQRFENAIYNGKAKEIKVAKIELKKILDILDEEVI